MARIVVYAAGYRGDVLPYAPIAAELARRGHDVRLVVPTEFHPLLAGEPFACAWSGPEFGPAQLERAAPFLARWGTRLGGALVGAYIMRMASDELAKSVEALEQECANADVVVSHPISAAFASIACERLGIPWVVGDLFPMLLPSASNPMPGLPDLGRRVNRRCWDIGRSPMFDRLSAAKRFKQERRRLGLSTDWNLVDGRSSPHLNLGLFSAHYVAPRADWPPPYKVVGFTSWGEPPGYTLPEEVTAWLAAGPPPVVVTLGTGGASTRPKLFSAAADALDGCGARGMFLVSTPANVEALRRIDGRHGVWAFLPLRRVLHHAAAVIHSGAHGTNALALEAGVPSAIRPCVMDQVWHARRQQELGTGVWVRGNRFSDPVRRILGDEGLRSNATNLAGALATDDGPRTAADAVDDFLAH